MAENSLNIGVVGAGAWGTALAQTAAIAGHRVVMLARRADVVRDISENHTNSGFLQGVALSNRIGATLDSADLGGMDAILLAVPAQITRHVLAEFVDVLKKPVLLILTAKGFEADSLMLQSQIVDQILPTCPSVVLSGPSFAVDVARGHPTAVTLASHDAKSLGVASAALASACFRPYASNDAVGVQVAGALKNVYALAAGAVEGAHLGLSARSALISRAQAEMLRMIKAMGGISSTGNSLAGLGDLVLSCTSEQSRNYSFGVQLGGGASVPKIKALGKGLAEGVFSAPVALSLAQKYDVDTPLIGAVNMLLGDKISIAELVDMLMSRPLKQET